MAVQAAAQRLVAKKPAGTKTKTMTTYGKNDLNNPYYNTGNVTSNARGNVQLQTNHALDMEALDATNQYNDTISSINEQEQAATLAGAQKQMDFDRQKLIDIGRMNATSAYRGLSGGAGADKLTDLWSTLGEQQNEITAGLGQAKTNAAAARGVAAARRKAALQQVTLGRQEYTDQQSKNAPTVGSKPENAGVKPTTIPKTTTVKKTTTPKKTTTTVKKTTTAKYKGKYPGPDVFKGNAKLNAAYSKAIKGKKLSDAAKRKIAQQLASGKK